MFTFFGVVGIVSLILSYLHFFRSDFTITLNKFADNVVIVMEDMIKRHRIKLGIMYLAIGFLLIYVGFLMPR